MEERIVNSKKYLYIILVLTLSILIFGSLVNSIMISVLGIFCWSIVYIAGKKQCNHEFSIIRILILSVPLSFIDIFGQPYGVTILSWYNIFLLFMIVTYLFKYIFVGKAYFNYLSLLSIIMLIIGIVPVMRGTNILEGLKQYINILVLLLLIIIGNSFKYNLTDGQKNLLKLDYIFATIITGFGVVIQILFVRVLNITIGNYNFIGDYRHAYGFLFADYSFLSLYLASGAMITYYIKNGYNGSKIKWIIAISFLLITSILTSARTGIVSFVAIFALYSLLNILNFIKKNSIKSIYVAASNIAIILMGYLLVSRTRNIAAFSDSGRIALNINAFNIFLENPCFGIGFGNSNFIGMIPHNLFLQSLAQGGLLYTIPLMLFLCIVLFLAYKKDKELLPVLLCVFFGSLFIPNIFNSRFLPILLLLLSIKLQTVNYKILMLEKYVKWQGVK